MTETHAPVLVRMSIEQKEKLAAAAKRNSRTLTGEINERLRISLAANGPTLKSILAREDAARTAPGIAPSALTSDGKYPAHITTALTVDDENKHASARVLTLTAVDHAMLDVFHTLPVEKQLALLSLFK